MKLTTAQRDALKHAMREGNPFAGKGCREMAGGPYRRMVKRLGKSGFLEKEYPWAITDEGRKALEPTP